MAFLRCLSAASVVPAAFAVAALSSSFQTPKSLFLTLSFPPSPSTSKPKAQWCSSFVPNVTPLQSALHMDSPTSQRQPSNQKDEILQELLTEFMVDMKCDGCVSAVKNKLVVLDGIKSVDVDLTNQVVRVLGTLPVKTMVDALEQTGRKARLIGQGSPEDFLISAAVAEFKGPFIFGVIRFAQVNMELARIEASFSGLSPGKHGWAINEFGDLTKGAASTGKVFNPTNQIILKEPLGDLGTLDVHETGEAYFSGAKQMLRVADLIGRSIVVYETEAKSDPGIAAAVIARSAGVGENYKKICTCDGTTIWESNNTNFATSQV
eukprot:TRINITY_DN5525_c0_g3_i1.p2 TRINITY_DN5525_c0_g3~~TRINITY_DN5525_c0_g3_i1.p2  ORF type:complete len:321 (-),score=50.15 TRINITY_DN5525_c0_g3_i1:1493-2455(-)